MSFYIIGLSGKKQSGKDTVCDIISKYCKHLNPVRIGFADALKDEVCNNYRITREYLEEHKSNFRLILQGHGTDYRRKLCSDTYWIEKMIARLNTLPSTCHLVIIPDVRFLNEKNLITDLGGEVWRIHRIHRDSIDTDAHTSEIELDDEVFNYLIDNTSSLTELHYSVHDALTQQKILKKQQ